MSFMLSLSLFRSDAAQGLSEAGRAWRNEDTKRAVQCLTQAATIMMEDNRFSPSAKLWVEVAEIYTADMDRSNACKAYIQAAECYKASNSKVTAQSMSIKAADLMALDARYNDAIKIYEEVAEGQADSSSVAFSVCGYYYKALLCKMVAESNTGCDELMDSEEKLARYCDIQPRMQDSKEANLVRSLIAAYAKSDADAFTQALSKYDSIYRLDQWSSELLYKVKKNLMGEGEAAKSVKPKEATDALMEQFL